MEAKHTAVQVIARKGTRLVRSSRLNSAGLFESRLYVSNGETATLICAKHKTIAGATKWADKVVSQ